MAYKTTHASSVSETDYSLVEQSAEDNAISMDAMAATSGSSEDATESEETVETVERESNFSDSVNTFAEGMTKEQKVAQLILTTPELLTGTSPVNIAGDGTISALKKYPVGGLVYSKINFEGTEQFHKLLGNANNFYTEIVNTNLWFLVQSTNDGTTKYAYQNTFVVDSLDQIKTGYAEEAAGASDLVDMLEEYTEGDIDSSLSAILVTSVEAAQNAANAGFMGLIIGRDGDPVEMLSNGCDMMLITEDLDGAYDEIINAIDSETLGMDRVEDAVRRVLTEKESLSADGLNAITTQIAEDTAAEETTEEAAPAEAAPAATE